MKFKTLVIIILCIGAKLYGQNYFNLNTRLELNELIEKGDSLIAKSQFDEALKLYTNNLNIRLDESFNNEAAIINNKIGYILYKNKAYKKAEDVLDKSILLDTSNSVLAEAYYNTFLVKRKIKQSDSIIFYLEKSLLEYKKQSNTYDANKAFLTAGIIYKNRQEFDKALHYLVTAYKGFSKLKNYEKLGDVCVTMANVHNRLKNYNQASQYYKEGLNLQKQTNNKKGIARSYSNLANLYDSLELLDSSVIYYKKALNYTKPNTLQYATITGNIANTYLAQKKYLLAKQNYLKAVQINTTLKDTTTLLYNYVGLSSLELEEDNIKASKLYLDKIEGLLKNNTDNIILLAYYKNRVEYYQKKKDYKQALNYQIKYSDLYQQIYNMEQTELAENIQAQFESKKKENEILKLNLSNKNKELELINKNKAISSKNNILIILSFSLFISLMSFYAYSQKLKLKAQQVKHDKLKAIYESQETIKKRIARDLHDIITTNFDGIRLKILALKKSKQPENLIDQTTNELKNINSQIRIVSHRLSPLEMQMTHQKFTEILKSRLSEFHLYGKIFVELDNPLPEVLNGLDIEVQNNFYGIVLEILNNVEKHSHATKLNIAYNIDKNDVIEFTFRDNGIGILEKFKEGIGLLNIKQRCEIINGNCEISNIKNGTQVTIKFSIN